MNPGTGVVNLGTIVETASFAVVLLCFAVMKWADRRAERRRGPWIRKTERPSGKGPVGPPPAKTPGTENIGRRAKDGGMRIEGEDDDGMHTVGRGFKPPILRRKPPDTGYREWRG